MHTNFEPPETSGNSPHHVRTSVVCLHCSGSSGRQWQAYQALLPSARLVAPDLLGSGSKSRWPLETEVRLSDEVAALEPILESAGARVHLVGHSYGGAVALAVAMRWPERVAGLYLFEPVRFALLNNPVDRTAWEEITGVGKSIAAFVRAVYPHASAELFVDYWSGAGSWSALPTARKDAVAARMPKVQAEFNALFSDDLAASYYAGLNMPIHLFKGSTSPWPARRVVDLLAAACSTSSVTQLESSGHMGPIDDPVRFANILSPLLSANELFGVIGLPSRRVSNG